MVDQINVNYSKVKEEVSIDKDFILQETSNII